MNFGTEPGASPIFRTPATTVATLPSSASDKSQCKRKNFRCCVGDGATDDTAAFRRAIEETDGGAIFIPAGKYVLTDIFEIRKPNIVLRGEGPDKTILYFPKGMEQIRPSLERFPPHRDSRPPPILVGRILLDQRRPKGALLGLLAKLLRVEPV